MSEVNPESKAFPLFGSFRPVPDITVCSELSLLFHASDIHQLKVMRLWTSIPGKVFHIVYISQLNNYSHYLPSIQKMIASLHMQSVPRQTIATAHYPGFNTGADPWAVSDFL